MGTLTVADAKALVEKERNKWIRLFIVVAVIAIVLFGTTIHFALKASSDKNAYPAASVEYQVYSLAFENVAESLKSTQLKVPHNATLYTVLEHAAWKDSSKFGFEYEVHPIYGKKITSIGGIHEVGNSTYGLYWMVYKFKGTPSANNKPTKEQQLDVGVDEARVKDGESYMFFLTEYNTPEEITMLKKRIMGDGPVSKCNYEL